MVNFRKLLFLQLLSSDVYVREQALSLATKLCCIIHGPLQHFDRSLVASWMPASSLGEILPGPQPANRIP